MNCSFCAVKTLEPDYVPRISIKEQIDRIRYLDSLDGKPGESRQDLLLMDNNVLKSSKFEEIIDEIVSLGFGKDNNTFIYKPTGKEKHRHVDFNQGLDAYLLTKKRAKLLGKLAIKPARIAFDHIEDKPAYVEAIKRCVYDGDIREFSNYILFNCDETSGKKKNYKADAPQDLYNRLRITLDLRESINADLRNVNKRIFIYSFPMKYAPLDKKIRDYVGKEWNRKYLRAIQVMLTPTMGKGVTSKSYFEQDFGKDLNEYMMNLLMPEQILHMRGILDKGKKSNKVSDDKMVFRENIEFKIWEEWKNLYSQLDENAVKELVNEVQDNKFSYQTFYKLSSEILKKLYLYYFSVNQFIGLLNDPYIKEEREFIRNYCTKEFPVFFDFVINSVLKGRYYFKSLIGFYKTFGDQGLQHIIENWLLESNDQSDIFIFENLRLLLTQVQESNVDIISLGKIKILLKGQLLSDSDISKVISLIRKNNYVGLKKFLRGKSKILKGFFKATLKDKDPLFLAIDATEGLF
jgi:hypothetical protein